MMFAKYQTHDLTNNDWAIQGGRLSAGPFTHLHTSFLFFFNWTEYFTGAILASGTPLCPFAFDPNVYEIAVQFTQAIEPTFKPANSTMILEFLQKVSAQDIMKGWNVSKLVWNKNTTDY